MLQTAEQEQAANTLNALLTQMNCFDMNSMMPDLYACPDPQSWLSAAQSTFCAAGTFRPDLVSALDVLANHGILGFPPLLQPSTAPSVQEDVPGALGHVGRCACSAQLDASDPAYAEAMEVLMLLTGAAPNPS